MRTRAGLIAIIVMLLAVMVGCMVPAVEEEITYRLVSLGPMSVSIPVTLERSQERLFGQSDADIPEGVRFKAYDSASNEIQFTLAEMDIEQMQGQESEDRPWEGWEAMEEMGVTRGVVAANLTLNNVLRGMGVWSVTRQVNRQLTVAGKEAWELQYRSTLLDEPVNFYFLVVLGDEYVWVILYSVKDDVWEKYDGTWDEIRDSVNLTLVD